MLFACHFKVIDFQRLGIFVFTVCRSVPHPVSLEATKQVGTTGEACRQLYTYETADNHSSGDAPTHRFPLHDTLPFYTAFSR